MKDRDSQGGSDKKGDYIMVTREIIRGLSDRRIASLTTDEIRICLILVEQTIGQHCELRGVTAEKFVERSAIPRATVFKAIKNLVETGVIKRERIKGIRATQYGLNPEFFGRIYPYEIENVYYLDKMKVHHNGLSKSVAVDFESTRSETFKVRKPALRAIPGVANISSNILANISLSRETRDFLNSRSQNTKGRWTALIDGILSQHPGDESLLLLAIGRIDKEHKDLFGNPIRASVIGLFENTEWPIMKAALIGILEREKQEQDKEKRRKEQEELVQAARERESLQSSNSKVHAELDSQNSNSAEYADPKLVEACMLPFRRMPR